MAKRSSRVKQRRAMAVSKFIQKTGTRHKSGRAKGRLAGLYSEGARGYRVTARKASGRRLGGPSKRRSAAQIAAAKKNLAGARRKRR